MRSLPSAWMPSSAVTGLPPMSSCVSCLHAQTSAGTCAKPWLRRLSLERLAAKLGKLGRMEKDRKVSASAAVGASGSSAMVSRALLAAERGRKTKERGESRKRGRTEE